jgi:tetratricopeptide (TPR) repeat protein
MGTTMTSSSGPLLAVVAGLLMPAATGSEGQAQREAVIEAERALTSLKVRAMSADYRADLAELARVREEALPLAGSPEVGYLAHYWAGYASWRWAINGASRGMGLGEIRGHLERAAGSFQASFEQRGDFADGHAAAASVNGWLASLLLQDDPPVARERWEKAARQLERARELAPDNPRVLWVVGQGLLFGPADRGGSVTRAIETYRRMLEAADAEAPTNSPRPEWGKPEALMSLAYAHLNQTAPDLEAALEEARAALRLQPDWSYVRDLLLPQIEAQLRRTPLPP